MTERLQVNWSMSYPPSPSKSTYIWPKQKHPPQPLEKDLHWPSGSLDILHKAFEQSLDRFTSWDVSSIKDASAHRKAAEVFRRGVPLSGQDVRQESGSYFIQFFAEMSPSLAGPKVIDSKVAQLWKFDKNNDSLFLGVNELSKDLKSVAKVCNFIRTQKTNAPLLLIGGGVLTDIAAFACHLEKRDYILVPTTLLSMVDACVGGKTGVNFPPFGKNQIGAFSFPKEVWVWPAWLVSLGSREYRAGLAECAKHQFLQNLDLVLPLEKEQLDSKILQNLVQVKSDIVALDPSELGERSTLNLGHTLAHALESISHKASKDPILHGEAVGMGLAFALQLSYDLHFLPLSEKKSLDQRLQEFKVIPSKQELIKYLGGQDLESIEFLNQLWHHISHDKKNSQGLSRWILLERAGQVKKYGDQFTYPVERSRFDASWQDFLGTLS